MTNRRNEIAKVLRELRKNWKAAVTIEYPESAKDIKVRQRIFRGMLARLSHVRGVKCSNQQDYAQLIFHDGMSVDTLYAFLSEHLNQDRMIEISHEEDYDGWPETLVEITEQCKESDFEYLYRMSSLLDKVKQATMTREDEIIALEKKLKALKENT